MGSSLLDRSFSSLAFGVAATFLWCTSAGHAAPVLQVGAFAGPGDTGIYADYTSGSINPTEGETAITSNSVILAAGLFRNSNVIKLGSAGSSTDWSDFGYDPVFDTLGAVLLVAVPDGTLATALANLTVNGSSAFYSSSVLNGYFPNNHDPLKDAISDFLFFDIGDFSPTVAIPDLASEDPGNKLGEIKQLTIAGTTNLDWLHFDLLALETRTQGQTNLVTSLVNNPASHDVTWKPPTEHAPEPASLAIWGAGALLAGAARWRRRRRA